LASIGDAVAATFSGESWPAPDSILRDWLDTVVDERELGRVLVAGAEPDAEVFGSATVVVGADQVDVPTSDEYDLVVAIDAVGDVRGHPLEQLAGAVALEGHLLLIAPHAAGASQVAALRDPRLGLSLVAVDDLTEHPSQPQEGTGGAHTSPQRWVRVLFRRRDR
jgi:hypothetical protein